VSNNHSKYLVTSESVSEGHPDKVCDYIADSILDACLAGDAGSHVASEVLCKKNLVILGGEITTSASIDYERVVRQAIRDVGYTDPGQPFCADTVQLFLAMTRQAAEIDTAVGGTKPREAQGAGDQGMMIGYATDETPERMPLPILLAHRLTRRLADDRKGGHPDWLMPDAKSQVTVLYEAGRPLEVTRVVLSTQHRPAAALPTIRDYVRCSLAPRALDGWFHDDIDFKVNPSGSFVEGGPSADCGVTGRKIVVDSYGAAARVGGGAFSGKDPSKVDRSAAYFCRYVARQVVNRGLAPRAEVEVAYAIGLAEPLAVRVNSFGTADDEQIAETVVREFDFRPASIIRHLDLLQPIYRQTTNYGHFGKPHLPWEA
jgi:S-adenosylmethionine synthetase